MCKCLIWSLILERVAIPFPLQHSGYFALELKRGMSYKIISYIMVLKDFSQFNLKSRMRSKFVFHHLSCLSSRADHDSVRFFFFFM